MARVLRNEPAIRGERLCGLIQASDLRPSKKQDSGPGYRSQRSGYCGCHG